MAPSYRSSDGPAHFTHEQGTRGVFAVILHGERLLISQYRDHQTWNLAGGGVRVGETDRGALVREVHQETGLDVIVHASVGGPRVHAEDAAQLYLCTVSGGELIATFESTRHRWVTPDDIGIIDYSGGPGSRLTRMIWDGLSLLSSPTIVTRRRTDAVGFDVTARNIYFPLPGGKALRWRRLPIL